MTHYDEQLPDPLRAAARGYNQPPDLSPTELDDIWNGINRATRERPAAPRWFTRLSTRAVASLAAALLLGVLIGRSSAPRAPEATVAAHDRAATRPEQLPEPYQSTTSRYLGQTAALLAALPADTRAGRADDRFTGRAHDLLLTTRLLLDSPAATDPRIRTLLDDLELVLAQIVRLQSEQNRTELELIRQSLEQRDVLPRLRTAVANISADD